MTSWTGAALWTDVILCSLTALSPFRSPSRSVLVSLPGGGSAGPLVISTLVRFLVAVGGLTFVISVVTVILVLSVLAVRGRSAGLPVTRLGCLRSPVVRPRSFFSVFGVVLQRLVPSGRPVSCVVGLHEGAEQSYILRVARVDLCAPQLVELADGLALLFVAPHAVLHCGDQAAGPWPLTRFLHRVLISLFLLGIFLFFLRHFCLLLIGCPRRDVIVVSARVVLVVAKEVKAVSVVVVVAVADAVLAGFGPHGAG